MSTCVVTGGAGFIGSHLCEALAASGHEVIAVDNLSSGDHRVTALDAAGVRLERLDIRDEAATDFIAATRPQHLFHLAAQSSVPVSVARPIYDAEVNIVGSLRLLEGAAQAGSRFIFSTSGGCIYGEQHSFPIPEEATGIPDSPYGIGKKSISEYLHFYAVAHGVPSVNLAFANVYGPRQDATGESGVVAIFGTRLLKGEPCIIYGDGKQTRDYVFVGDVVDACIAAMGAGEGELINVGTGIETPLLELYTAIAEAAGVPDAEPVFEAPRKGDLLRSALDIAKAGSVLGWKPRVELSDGVRRTVDSIRAEL